MPGKQPMLKHDDPSSTPPRPGIVFPAAAMAIAGPPALPRAAGGPQSLWWRTGPNSMEAVATLLRGEQRWAHHYYRLACRHQWSPADIDLTTDLAIPEIQDELAGAERRVALHALSWLHAMTSAATRRPPALITWHLLGSPDCRQFLARQLFDEGQRPAAVRIATATLETATEDSAATPPITEPARRLRDWLQARYDDLAASAADADPPTICHHLAACHVVAKALLLQPIAIQLLTIGRRGRLLGMAQLFGHLLHDEIIHLQFGLTLIKHVARRQGELHPERLHNILAQAIELATDQAYASLPQGLPGLNAPMLEEYLAHAANRCCDLLQLPPLQPGAINPFSWMSELRPPAIPILP
ncbi:MAG: hypothetical protein D6720_11820 [Gammaproteobacteria bacterium]|nr:MAG: hypothetical protein D6720_11820 [Gammaproteobacteria bacterium]